MRSRSNSLEEEGSPDPLPPRGRGQEERETPPGRAGGRSRYREGATPVAAQRNRRKAESARGGGASGDRKEKGRDLSRDDLLFLLSMLEGELQARDEVITVLRAENVDLALLEAKYGFVVPHQVLRALQRDTPPGRDRLFQEDIYEKPMAELERLVETQRRAGARTLEQLLRAERSLRHALAKMADGERNHQDFMRKSDDFTNLLEQERERLKLLLDQEKAYQERKEEESNKKVLDLKDELTKLKSFALMVVDEQQRLTEQLGQQTARVQELTAAATNAQEELGAADARLQEEEGKVSGLESQLREHACRRQQEQEAMTAKLAGEDAQNRVLRQKLSTLGRQRDELEETNKTLRRAEEELQELRDKIGRGDCGNSSLMSEVEELRKRVLEMEGKDEELIRMEEQCRDLNRKLVKEAGQSQGLKVEVDKLNQRIMELEKLEEAFGKSKQECSALKGNLEKEKLVSKVVASDLDALRAKVKELETAESQLGKTEASLKEDLTKLKTLTVMLMDERKTTAERMRQMESKVQNSSGKLQAEQDMVNSVTERLIGESKRALRSKAELEQKMCSATKERDELKAKLRAEVEKSRDLDSKVGMMKKRLQSLEHVESEYIRSGSREEREHATTPAVAKRFQQEDNKVRELTQEVERLRNKLKDGKAVEGEPPKNDELELLEKSFAMEREKARTLTEELDILRTELSKYQLAEKNDCHQQHVLYKRLKEEEAKSSHLTLEVSALKEKIHEFMGTEESICRMKNDHTSQQRRLTQQEVRNKELAREMDTLTRELDRYRRFSKSLRPGMSGRRFSDLLVSTKEVQTEPADLPRSSGAAAEPLERAVLNGRLEHSGEDEGSSGGAVRPAAPSPSLWNHNAASLRPPGRGSPPGGDGGRGQGPPGRQGEALLNHSPGRPLHIRVTPDLGVNAALLEMASPERHAPSYTSTALIPTGGGPAKQRITIIQNASPSPAGAAPQPGALSPVQVVSAPRGGPGAAGLRGAPERRGGWPVQRSDSGGPPAVFTTDDNKIHIHLGAPFLQSISGGGGHALLQTAGPARASAAPDQRPVAKGNGKVTSSITIKPTSGPMQRPAHITVSSNYD